MGEPLEVNMVAVDQAIIAADSKITIPSLPIPWDKVIFTGSDIGTSIIGKHVDIYTGEGKSAEGETYRITSNDNIVCREVK